MTLLTPSQSLNELPLTAIPGIKEQTEKKVNKLNIYKPLDLLFHLPHSYHDKTRLTPIGNIKEDSYVLVSGIITKTNVSYARKKILTTYIEDNTGKLNLKWFRFYPNQVKTLKEGLRLIAFGKVNYNKNQIQMSHPEYRVHPAEYTPKLESHLTPIYPKCDGLPQTVLQKSITWLLNKINKGDFDIFDPLNEILPKELKTDLTSYKLIDALNNIHQPSPELTIANTLSPQSLSRQRLVLEELTAYQLILNQSHAKNKQQSAPKFNLNLSPKSAQQKFIDSLPFSLTADQYKALEEINTDLQQASAMNRLVQGDVGAGKTVIALAASITAMANNYQAVIMAPTELLATQHLESALSLIGEKEYKIFLLTGRLTKKQKTSILEDIKNNPKSLIIGTHALFQENVIFPSLGLIIIDEQHRFGVHQRWQLKQKQSTEGCHQLLMTATPIPRTLTMSWYGHMAISIIKQLPPGRKPITSSCINIERLDDVVNNIKNRLNEKEQVYWICPLIETSEKLPLTAATARYEYLSEQLQGYKIGLVHGQMKPNNKEEVMSSYKNGDIDLLVATTVIEVGVNVPNATVMVIEHAERLGLSQLHQIRGRIGRSSLESYCLMLYQGPLSKTAKQRLKTIRNSQDGFEIAEEDLKLRGGGEILGTEQTGESPFRLVDMSNDHRLLIEAKKLADFIEKHPDISEILINRWLKNRVNYQGT